MGARETRLRLDTLSAIVKAIRDGDGDRAARDYTKMLSQQAEMVVDLFHDRSAVRQAV